jgi:hypothetical protein
MAAEPVMAALNILEPEPVLVALNILVAMCVVLSRLAIPVLKMWNFSRLRYAVLVALLEGQVLRAALLVQILIHVMVGSKAANCLTPA